MKNTKQNTNEQKLLNEAKHKEGHHLYYINGALLLKIQTYLRYRKAPYSGILKNTKVQK